MTPLPTPARLPAAFALPLPFNTEPSLPRLPVPPSEFPLPCNVEPCVAILCSGKTVAHPLLPKASVSMPATTAGPARQRRCLVRRAGEALSLRSSCTRYSLR